MTDNHLTVLIVDDEKIDRDAYRLMLTRCMPALRIVGEVENGMEAVRFCCAHKPDIVLMDIQMPNLNGIETIRLLRAEGLDLNFVIISAYDYFEYAKEALDLGVLGFLVKPVSEEELFREMQRICTQVYQRKTRLIAQLDTLKGAAPLSSRTKLLEDLFFAIRTNAINSISTFAELCGCDVSVGRIAIAQLDRTIPDTFLTWIVRRSRYIWNVLWQEGSIFALLLKSCSDDGVCEEFQGLRTEAQLRFQVNPCFYVGGEYTSLRESGRSFMQAVACWESIQNVCVFDATLERINYPYPFDYELTLLDAIQRCDHQRCTEVLDEIVWEVENFAQSDFDRTKFIMYELFLTLSRQDIRSGNRDLVHLLDRANYEMIADVHALRTYFQECLECLLGSAEESCAGHEKIHPILEYIRSNYNKDIALSNVAKRFYFSQGYLSRLLKKVTGLSYTEYVTGLRVERAMKLLRSTRSTISEISMEVGYKDANYFSKVFKKATGQTPQAFRQDDS